MSADNRLLLFQDRWEWFVWNASGSCDYYEPPGNALSFATEAEARDYMETRRDDYFEYGHQTLGVDEQRVALTDTIRYLQERLGQLNSTGSQWPVSS